MMRGFPLVMCLCFGVVLAAGCETSDSLDQRSNALTLPSLPKNGAAGATSIVTLPERANGLTTLRDASSASAVRFSAAFASSVAGESREGATVYRGAVRGADLLQRVSSDGVEDFVRFASKPTEESLAYDVDVSKVSGMRLIENVIELLDASGTPRLRVNPPYVIDGSGRRVSAALSIEGCAFDSFAAPPWGRPVTIPGKSHCTFRVRWRDVVYPALVDPAWTSTGNMISARSGHSAVLLSTGKILVAGGGTQTTELYDPATGTFAAGPTMNAAAGAGVALKLGSGKVLLAVGGTIGQIYDPSTGTLTNTPALANTDQYTDGVVLTDGRVLLAGPTDSQIYNATSNTFTALPTRTPSGGSTLTDSLTLLTNGTVLGVEGSYASIQGVELFNPVTNAFSVVGSSETAGYGSVAVRLASGKVLVTGGHPGLGPTANARIYDPATTTIADIAPMISKRELHRAVLLASGKVLIVGGGSTVSNDSLATTETYDPSTGLFTAAPPMVIARKGHTATLLPDDTVVVIGGTGTTNNTLASAERARFEKIGATCTGTTDCESGNCVDGVCCASACTGPCEACDVAGSVGTCSLVSGAPHGKHDCGDPGVCAGTCDGKNTATCVYPIGNAACGESCSGNNDTIKTCDGVGHCVAEAPRICDGNLLCGETQCKTDCGSSGDCLAGFECGPDGTCRSGAACSDLDDRQESEESGHRRELARCRVAS